MPSRSAQDWRSHKPGAVDSACIHVVCVRVCTCVWCSGWTRAAVSFQLPAGGAPLMYVVLISFYAGSPWRAGIALHSSLYLQEEPRGCSVHGGWRLNGADSHQTMLQESEAICGSGCHLPPVPPPASKLERQGPAKFFVDLSWDNPVSEAHLFQEDA